MNHINKSSQQQNEKKTNFENNMTTFQKFMSTHHSDNRYQAG